MLGEEAADYIGEIMNNEFNTVCEDGSLEEIGDKLCSYFQLLRNGRSEEVIGELQKMKPSSGVLKSQKSETRPSDDDQMDVVVEPMNNLNVDSDSPRKPKNEPDEDGWVTVTKGKK